MADEKKKTTASEKRKRYDVRVKVISQTGICHQGHKVGDEWVIAFKTPPGMCMAAFGNLYTQTRILRYGGVLPAENDPDTCIIACPDINNPVHFELKRIQ